MRTTIDYQAEVIRAREGIAKARTSYDGGDWKTARDEAEEQLKSLRDIENPLDETSRDKYLLSIKALILSADAIKQASEEELR